MRADQKPRWESGPWVKESETNSPALQPPAKGVYGGVVKTLPDIHTQTIVGELPQLAEEVSVKNEVFLEIKGGWTQRRWILIFASPLLLVMLPATLAFLGWSLLSIDSYLGLEALIVAVITVLMAFYLSYPGYYLTFWAYESEPFRFDRTTRKLYWFRAPRRKWPGYEPIPKPGKPEIKIYDWENIRAEVTRNMVTNGNTAGRVSYLQLAVLDPASGQVLERFRIGNDSLAGPFSDRVALWETIRRFMEEGPDAVPDAVDKFQRVTLIDFWDACNPLTRLVESTTGGERLWGRILSIPATLLAPLLLLIGLCHWIAYRTARKVSWGELDTTVFKLPPTAQPKVNLAQAQFEADTPRRRRFVFILLGVFVAEVVAFFWWGLTLRRLLIGY
ncbi:DUF6708 domain-containing protein [Chitinimonas taiwanensis]|nr:DUF6708 domain-containing protein [Chitinimonas taiwanensis]